MRARNAALIFVVVVVAAVWLLGSVLMPFLVAAGLAYLCDPLVDRVQRLGANRTVSVGVVFALVLIALALALLALVPAIQNQLATFIQNLPRYIDWVRRTAQPWVGQYVPGLARFDVGAAQKMLAEHWSSAGGVASTIAQSLFSSGTAIIAIGVDVLLIPVILFYLLRDWDHMLHWIRDQLPRRYLGRCVSLAREIDAVLSQFLRGQLLVMAALGSIYVIGLWLAGLKLALVIGVGAGLVSFIPYVGVISGLLVSTVAMLVQTGDPTGLIWVGLVFGVGQIMEQVVLQPLLVGDAIGLHPVWVIFAVLAGGQLFGFVGVLLALPAAAVVTVLGRHGAERWRVSRPYNT